MSLMSIITVGWRGGALEDPLGHLDRVHQGVVHAGQFLAEALQHGVEHGVELAGEVVQRGEAPVLVDALGVAGVVSYGQLRRAAAHQRRADDAESLCPGAVQVLPPAGRGRISPLENQTSRRIAKDERRRLFSPAGRRMDGVEYLQIGCVGGDEALQQLGVVVLGSYIGVLEQVVAAGADEEERFG